jgi:hypothetical protein
MQTGRHHYVYFAKNEVAMGPRVHVACCAVAVGSNTQLPLGILIYNNLHHESARAAVFGFGYFHVDAAFPLYLSNDNPPLTAASEGGRCLPPPAADTGDDLPTRGCHFSPAADDARARTGDEGEGRRAMSLCVALTMALR